MEQTKIAVRYVGKKPVAFDNVANSGKSWNGHGDVQEVTPAQAKTLTGYADQWQLADGVELEEVQTTINVPTGNDESVDVTGEEIDGDIHAMTKPQLMAYAKHMLDKELKPVMAKAEMIDQIEEWQKEAGL